MPVNTIAVIDDKSIGAFSSPMQIRFACKRKFFPPKEKHLLLLYRRELSDWLVAITVLKDQYILLFKLDAKHKLENTETVIYSLWSIFSWLLRLKTFVDWSISWWEQNNNGTYSIVVSDQKKVICMVTKLMNWNRNKMFKDKACFKNVVSSVSDANLIK